MKKLATNISKQDINPSTILWCLWSGFFMIIYYIWVISVLLLIFLTIYHHVSRSSNITFRKFLAHVYLWYKKECLFQLFSTFYICLFISNKGILDTFCRSKILPVLTERGAVWDTNSRKGRRDQERHKGGDLDSTEKYHFFFLEIGLAEKFWVGFRNGHMTNVLCMGLKKIQRNVCLKDRWGIPLKDWRH